ncbi:UDP-N-acetylmuramoyl-tripeptide--D-alanyl-D-alanine ligase [Methylomonas sp. LL1]|uniref:UDP-N-acetylmuramoyl-tripeptide--D-alanyl-D- alanine ligase n=1 Tax=Methylomonas sp. LL1 TaxID=2785785 RepID=UPI0018C4278D|nr:UDP-N-acetylmuramoyl-tripeptide--D-alanyl-D-alanine ligase [Methylomonas sp. LL1]QPK62509.1 UDP-N-acetylmuramoyl-tripeptide--D-alanyl-D-alanine ligase [Methylomonas sp. LL1]
MKLQLSDIAQAVQGTLIGNDLTVTGVGIDTRTLNSGDLYIAIKGQHFDGHDFVGKAEQAGAAAILVSQPLSSPLPQIRVKDTHLALAELAGYWRKRLAVKIAGVTGSNGKTSVKEMIAAIFATQGNTLFTQGNLNNDIGVPLTLLRLDQSHGYAVIEMGANHPGEIAYTSRYAQADVCVITNVGQAHIEGFGDISGVANTKAEIIESLSPEGTAVLNRDDPFYDFWLEEKVGQRKHASFGFDAAADVRAENIIAQLDQQGFTTRFDLKTKTESLGIQLNLAGEHNVKNALAAAAVAMQFGIGLADIKRGLEQMKPVTGRMQALQGRKNNLVIDDTYNANPASLKAALTAVSHCQQPIWLALGAFGELGNDSPAIHAQMGDMIKAIPVQRLFATGELARYTVNNFGDNGQFFDTQEQLINTLNQAITGQEIILVKGSRAQKMENVVAALVDNFRAA